MMKKVTSALTSEEDDYKYHLIQFCQSQQDGILDIDVVPSSWVLWDRNKNISMAKYPPPPYTKKTGKHLERLVRGRKSPPNNWPSWDVLVKGGADTYEIALRRVEKLKEEPYAFTTDGDLDGATRASKITEAMKKKTTGELFSVAGIDDFVDDEWTSRSKAIHNPSDTNNNSESSLEEEYSSVTKTSAPLKHRKKKSSSTSSSQERNPDDTESATQCTQDYRKKTGASKEQISENDLSPDTKFLLKILTGLRIDLQTNTAAINALRDTLVVDRNCTVSEYRTVDQVEKVYDLRLPLNDQQLFQAFDDKLREDDEMNRALKQSLKQLLDRNNNMTKSVTTILRKFLDRDMVMKFTAKKKVEGKMLFKATAFGSCLMGTLTDFHTLPDGTPVNEDSVLKSVGSAISNAKDWDGRKGRISETTCICSRSLYNPPKRIRNQLDSRTSPDLYPFRFPDGFRSGSLTNPHRDPC